MKGVEIVNRKQKRRLKRNAKVAVVCLAALYLVVGVALAGSKTATDEGGTGNVYAAQDILLSIPILSKKTEPSELMVIEKPNVGTDRSDSLAMSYDWDADESYLLAKIAMAEAEGEDTEGKALVMLVVLNRACSDGFPDSIEEVILQDRQFSPVTNGRWDRVEPDQDCWDALKLIENGWDESQGALYFESKSKSNWHRRNLEFLFQHGCHYFYTEKGIEG